MRQIILCNYIIVINLKNSVKFILFYLKSIIKNIKHNLIKTINLFDLIFNLFMYNKNNSKKSIF